jgi:hypothetical protein
MAGVDAGGREDREVGVGTTWRYVFAKDERDGEVTWTVRELYTGADGSVLSWTAEPVAARGDTWQELAEDLIRMEKAFGAREALDLTADPPGLRPVKGLGRFQ